SRSSKKEIAKRARTFSLEEAKLIFKQGFSLGDDSQNINQADKMKSEINRLNLQLNEKDKIADSIISKEKLGRQILVEVKTIFPEITSCSYAETKTYLDSAKSVNAKLVVMETKGRRLSNKDRKKINEWLKKRLRSEDVKTFFQ
ncbi:MAG TPA: hypothetical protein VFR70_08510, partial [Flavobacterium sp.]|nr:hypothetical protein [Flavobacterium sp.]